MISKDLEINVWWLNLECSIVEKFFRIHLRQLKHFDDVKLLSLSTKTKFQIIHLGGYVLGIVLKKLLNNDDKNVISNFTVNCY